MVPEWKAKRLERLQRELPPITFTQDPPSELLDRETKMLRDPQVGEDEVDAVIRDLVAFYSHPPPGIAVLTLPTSGQPAVHTL